MEELLIQALTGVYLLVILSLAFNFMHARRIYYVENQLNGVDRATKADFKKIRERLNLLNEIIES